MNTPLRIVIILLSIASISGCIESDKPLFPTNKWRKETPVKSGYYVTRDVFANAGQADRRSSYEEAMIIKSNGKQYHAFGDVDLDKVDSFEIFGAGTEKFIVQARKRSGKQHADIFADSRDPAYTYGQILIGNNDRFILYKNDCRSMRSSLKKKLYEERWMKPMGAGCIFDDPDKLVATIGGDSSVWQSHTLKYFYRISDQPAAQENLKHKVLIPIPPKNCDMNRDRRKIVMGPAFPGSPTEVQGPHLRLISKTDRDNATIERAILVEALGDKVQNYAWIGDWWDSPGEELRLYCSPSQVIKILSYMPKTNSINQLNIEPNLDEVRNQCLKAQQGNDCGTLDEIVSKYQADGLNIIIQGIQILQFPDNTFSEGGLITVMGLPGNSSRMVALITYTGRTMERGVTRLLFKF